MKTAVRFDILCLQQFGIPNGSYTAASSSVKGDERHFFVVCTGKEAQVMLLIKYVYNACSDWLKPVFR